MRLTNDEVNTLKASLSMLSKTAQLFLFGSRVDDTKRGGDIDLLVVSSELTLRDLRKIKFDFFDNFGEQKIDIVLDDGKKVEPFIELIKAKAVLI